MAERLDAEKLWTRFLLVLKTQNPFFSALAMYAKFECTDTVELASTTGKTIHISPQFIDEMPEAELFSYLLHQVLHLALSHSRRGLERNTLLWNMAADIVVNCIITQHVGWSAARNTAWDMRFVDQSVERVYSSLLRSCNDAGSRESHPPEHNNAAATAVDGKQLTSEARYSQLAKKYGCHADLVNDSSVVKVSESYWRAALVQAKHIQRQMTARQSWGNTSAGLEREIELASTSQFDWRDMLWKYASPDMSDYQEFDRRFMYQRRYTEVLLTDNLHVCVAIDTSGSVSMQQLSQFMQELQAVTQCYPHISLQCFFADTELYGPYLLDSSSFALPTPVGGGYTSFEPFFTYLDTHYSSAEQPQAAIYLTDGFGGFPATAPAMPVLWVLTEDGAEDNAVPFGTVVRMRA
ncbi:VWA-like domain-containing protein [Rheinheimera baltica]|uniref:VWA-like domain-containing protein n=1 Tax=Rheinheimera baltica TaxID=67576 RepID=A0ABT9HWW1_9GAMM|nr:VWA-like domain-containing protein [Rheinheimera baltica]MDP5135166.1 VWA-like domain-containing protein [Rheinheimera baltica]